MYYRLNDQDEPVPCELMEWAESSNQRRRQIGYDKLPNGFLVSTVFLGLDHAHDGGPPLLWETMVFDGGYGDDRECERYSTKADALAGHDAMVGKYS